MDYLKNNTQQKIVFKWHFYRITVIITKWLFTWFF